MNFKDPELMVPLAEALRRTLDPWEPDNTPVGTSTRIKTCFIRRETLTKALAISLSYLGTGPHVRTTRGALPAGWQLAVPGEDPIFSSDKMADSQAQMWADTQLRAKGWIFRR